MIFLTNWHYLESNINKRTILKFICFFVCLFWVAAIMNNTIKNTNIKNVKNKIKQWLNLTVWVLQSIVSESKDFKCCYFYSWCCLMMCSNWKQTFWCSFEKVHIFLHQRTIEVHAGIRFSSRFVCLVPTRCWWTLRFLHKGRSDWGLVGWRWGTEGGGREWRRTRRRPGSAARSGTTTGRRSAGPPPAPFLLQQGGQSEEICCTWKYAIQHQTVKYQRLEVFLCVCPGGSRSRERTALHTAGSWQKHWCTGSLWKEDGWEGRLFIKVCSLWNLKRSVRREGDNKRPDQWCLTQTGVIVGQPLKRGVQGPDEEVEPQLHDRQPHQMPQEEPGQHTALKASNWAYGKQLLRLNLEIRQLLTV